MKIDDEQLYQDLRYGYRLLKGGKGWTKGYMARTKSGSTAVIGSPNACQFCSLGAIHQTTLDNRTEGVYSTAHRHRRMENELLMYRLPRGKASIQGIVYFNDNNDWKTVGAAWRNAIRRAKRRIDKQVEKAV